MPGNWACHFGKPQRGGRMSYPSNADSVAADQIRAFVERVERLHEERKSIADDIKEVYAEAKGNGFDIPALKHVIKLRAQDEADRMEFEAVVDLYMAALGVPRARAREED